MFIKHISSLFEGLSCKSYDWLSILRLVQKNMSGTATGVTVVSGLDASINASPVILSSAIVDLKTA